MQQHVTLDMQSEVERMAKNEDQWTVRGIPAEMRRQVAAAAERAGMKVGPWVERALRAALERPEGQGVPAGQGGAGDLAALVAAISATVDAQAEAIHVLFEHRRQDFPAIVKRLERLEAAQAVPAIPSRQGRAPDAVEPAEGAKVPAKAEPHPGPAGAAGEPLVAGGSGTRRRLTAAGVAEVERLIEAGVGDAEIAGRLGMDRAAIRQRRLKRAKAGQTSGSGSRQGAGEEGPTTAQLLQMADEAERTLPPIERVRRVGEMMTADEPATEVLKVLRGKPEERR